MCAANAGQFFYKMCAWVQQERKEGFLASLFGGRGSRAYLSVLLVSTIQSYSTRTRLHFTGCEQSHRADVQLQKITFTRISVTGERTVPCRTIKEGINAAVWPNEEAAVGAGKQVVTFVLYFVWVWVCAFSSQRQGEVGLSWLPE